MAKPRRPRRGGGRRRPLRYPRPLLASWIQVSNTRLSFLTNAPICAGLLYRRKCARLTARVRELEDALADAAEKAAAERRGRVRAQQVGPPRSSSIYKPRLHISSHIAQLRPWQSLRKALSEQGASPDKVNTAKAVASYPMAPIGTVQSCFSTRCCSVTQRA